MSRALLGDRAQGRTRRLTRWAVAIATTQITVAYLAYWLWTGLATNLRGPDFFSFHAAARVALGRGFGAVYDLTAQKQAQDQITAGWDGHFILMPYIHPPYYTFLIAPLGWLSLRDAYLTWGLITIAALGVGIAVTIRGAALDRSTSLLWGLAAAAYLPVFVTLLQGQSDGIVLLGLGLAALAWTRGRPGWAGLSLTLCLVKPQLILLLPALFLVRRAPRGVLVLMIAGLGLCGLALAFFGVAGWDRFLSVLVPWLFHGNADFPIREQTVFSLRGLLELVPGGRPTALVLLLLALALAATSLTWRPHRPRLDFALAATWSVVLSPYQNFHDLSLLVVPMLLLAGILVVPASTQGEGRLAPTGLRWTRVGWAVLVGSYLSVEAMLVLGPTPAALGALLLALYLTAERLSVATEPVPLGELKWAGPRPRRIAVLPAYRAERTLREVVRRIPKNEVDAILLVDDASDDRTAELALELGLHVIKHPSNLGYGGNQKSCYANALLLGAEVVVMLHPDGQYEPELVPALCREIEEGRGDIALGSRWLNLDPARAGMPWWKRWGNRFLTGVENRVLGLRLSEYHTGYRAYSRRFLETIPFAANSDDFVFDTQVLVAAAAFGLEITEIPAVGRYFADASSTSFRTSVIYGFKTLGCLARYLLHRAGVPCRWLRPASSPSPLPTVSSTS